MGDLDRIEAVIRLLEPDDITPTGARMVRRVLEEIEDERDGR